jgi:mono/diheme cytochrome c family protein
MNCIKVFLGLVLIAVVVGVIVMYTGVINVAATNPHNPITAMVLSTTMDNSVRAHAKGISAPALEDEQMVTEGFGHYREMCVECHLAPGISSSEIRAGLMPTPPKLQEAVKEWQPAELFWVIKNGVKMTGMPAWGPTHSDAKIWSIVAFLEKLPDMTADQYREMDKMAGQVDDDEDADHHHGGGGQDHADEPDPDHQH